MTLFFVQMSGVPGSGKSTIARAIGEHFHAIVLDHDDTKTAIKAAGIADALAGKASYEVLKALSTRFLAERHSVVFDSPCLYDELLHHGTSIAATCNAAYRYIECQLSDLEQLQQRLLTRTAKPSQVRSLSRQITHQGVQWSARELFVQWAANMKRPPQDHLTLDTSAPLADCLARALRYVELGT